MIRERLLALRERRALLVARAEDQRNAMAGLVARAEAASLWLERGRALLQKLRTHPLWVAAGVALLVAFRPRKSLRLIATGVSLWRGWRGLRTYLARIVPPQARARANNF